VNVNKNCEGFPLFLRNPFVQIPNLDKRFILPDAVESVAVAIVFNLLQRKE
jgi:hypothetical protein